MQIQVNTDKNISGHEALAQSVETTLNHTLARFTDHITRLEVHLSDENSTSKSGPVDKRCLLEARLAGRQPTSVSDQSTTIDQAVSGAAHKMVRLLESELGKLDNH
ncbi:HPF/RaiA family ribosome-associated protein [Synechococcus sp. CCY9201]|uniref:HPF/RaiA family ribosome-associated protein n=1 Tax=Synechococcus sp. CCY9201 TaxID=174697 RepID=UPI002B1F338E|nr:HPF/RaiA family ribosome-associated protein [Synechococcus sp. CCY9201]MEA5473439.1 HPF/RaiA family ribosome-associated protein [Synechococcus sp. CCY9201]